jgi:HSF-type DNA-binding
MATSTPEGSETLSSSDRIPYKIEKSQQGSEQMPANRKVNSNRADQNFPVKLHYILSELERDGLSHIVSWQPHGRCFVVRDQKEFVERVLPL